MTTGRVHLYGNPENSRENSNGTFHPGGNLPEKKEIPFEVLPFSRFYRNDRNFLYYFFGFLVPGFMSRGSENLYLAQFLRNKFVPFFKETYFQSVTNIYV